MNLNKVQLIGRVVRDPELKALPSGTKVCSFSLAMNRFYTQNDEKKEETEFANCVAFGKTAEIIAQYVQKGGLLYVEGRLSTRSWDDKTSGEKKYRTEIIIDNVQLPPKSMSAGSSSSVSRKSAEEEDADRRFDEGGNAPAKAPSKKAPASMPTIQYPDEDINPDDIPF